MSNLEPRDKVGIAQDLREARFTGWLTWLNLCAHKTSAVNEAGEAGRMPEVFDKGVKQKTPRDQEASSRWLLGVSPIVPDIGLALAPWRLHQVAGRFIGPVPSAPLLIFKAIL